MSRPLRVAHITTIDLTLRAMLLDQMSCIQEHGYEVVGISAPGPWTGAIEEAGIRHIAWPHATRSWNPRSDMRAVRELHSLLRRERFDIVHTHNPKPGLFGRMTARAVGVPVVVNTVHGLYTTPEDPLRRRAPVLGLEWAAARCSDYELFQSAEDLAWARRLRIVKPDRSEHLGNGIDLTRFDPAQVTTTRLAALRDELGIAPGELVVGVVGRLVAEKGYRELFEALEALRSEIPGIRALVIGDADPDKPDALASDEIRRATEAGAIFLGWREDVRDLLALMDVFTLPSWREGLPRSAVEAAAMGRPLVLTDIRGCREVVDHMDQGLLVPPRDPAALASALHRMLTDEELRVRTGERARSRAIESFDERAVAGKVVAVYDRLTESNVAVPVTDNRRIA